MGMERLKLAKIIAISFGGLGIAATFG